MKGAVGRVGSPGEVGNSGVRVSGVVVMLQLFNKMEFISKLYMLFIFFIQGEKGDEGIHGLAGVKGPDVRDLSFFKSSFAPILKHCCLALGTELL